MPDRDANSHYYAVWYIMATTDDIEVSSFVWVLCVVNSSIVMIV